MVNNPLRGGLSASVKDRGFQVETLFQAKGVLSGDFPEAAEIEAILHR